VIRCSTIAHLAHSTPGAGVVHHIIRVGLGPSLDVCLRGYFGPASDGEGGPKSADSVEKVENRATRKISRKLTFGFLCRCVALQSRYGGRWSILDETIWSLTSQRMRRTSGPESFQSTAKRTFSTLSARLGHQPRYSITSSARASSDGEISSPSALAVLRLTIRSNLVGCSTGMSAGLVPRRILST